MRGKAAEHSAPGGARKVNRPRNLRVILAPDGCAGVRAYYGARMKKLSGWSAAVLVFAAVLTGGARAAELSPIEQQVAEAVQSPKVTIVHFWATWCGNCKNELVNGGWRDFLAANPDVNVIFVTSWDPKPGAPELEKYGLGAQKNFTVLQHPNDSRKKETQMLSFLGLPMQWLPTTWVYREGKLRYALNYGEIRFPMLQQMVADSVGQW
jgi:thiol-disulfide isomerase/thioredoxin